MKQRTAYNPACDADQYGKVDMVDIQLSAGVWTGAGVWGVSGSAGAAPGATPVGASNNQAFPVWARFGELS